MDKPKKRLLDPVRKWGNEVGSRWRPGFSVYGLGELLRAKGPFVLISTDQARNDMNKGE